MRIVDVSAAAAAAVTGATVVDTVAAAGDGADCLFTSLPGPAEVEATVAAVLATNRGPAVLVDLSTDAPDVVRRLLHEALAAAGVGFVRHASPVVGSRPSPAS